MHIQMNSHHTVLCIEASVNEQAVVVSLQGFLSASLLISLGNTREVRVGSAKGQRDSKKNGDDVLFFI